MSFPLVRSSISLTEKESQSQINPRVPYTEWSRQSKSQREISEGFCFVNLVDFDALWGHRRDVKGYAQELEKFDVKLGELLGELKEDDLLSSPLIMEMIRHIPEPTTQEKRCRSLRILRL